MTAAVLWTEEAADRPGRRRIRARIGGLHCSLCTGTIEKALGTQAGVDRVAVSLTHEQALVEYDPTRIDAQTLLKTLKDLGYTLSDPRKLRPFEEEEAELLRESNRLLAGIGLSLVAVALVAARAGSWALLLPAVVCSSLLMLAFLVLRGRSATRAWVITVALGGLVAGVWVLRRAWSPTVIAVVSAGIAAVMVFGVGRPFLVMGLQALRRRIINQHVLLEIGALAGIAGGLLGWSLQRPGYPVASFFAVAVMVVTYHTFSEWLSLLVKTRSSQAIKRLLDLQPDTAERLDQDGSREVAVEDIVVGDQIRVRPGQRVPLDGVVVDGRSMVDQAWVTGEPIPVEACVGVTVVGGSLNGTGSFTLRVTALAIEGFLSQVVRHVEDARALKPGVLHLVDRILRLYTPLVLGTALLATVFWIWIEPVLGGTPDLKRALFAGLSVLVMGYPCAVGISAPLAIVRGAGEAAASGIIMRTGEAFQSLRLVTQMALDKTGTLTEGHPSVTERIALAGTAADLLALAAGLEIASEHPLGQAVMDAAFAEGVIPRSIEAFEAHPGQGVSGRDSGRAVALGSPAFLGALGYVLEPGLQEIACHESAGRTVIGVGAAGVLLGLLVIEDRVRADAPAALAALRASGVTPILVTGDNAGAARVLADRLGISAVHAGLLPQQKAALIRTLQLRGRVAMVGDGINDAPALMQADVGIAMGGGTDIAMESADIVLVGGRLMGLVEARSISRRSYRTMLQNISLAFLFNGVGIPAAATGLLFPVWAMAAMAFSVTAIFINSLWGRAQLFTGALRSVGARD